MDSVILVELHDKYKNYLMLPEHYITKEAKLFINHKELISMIYEGKLINYIQKKNYIIDFRMLKECLR